MVDGKAQDLGQKLAKRRSQDFKSKVAVWNDKPTTPPPEDDVIVVQIIDDNTTDGGDGEQNTSTEAIEKTTPKALEVIQEPVVVTPTPRKRSIDVDAERRAWVRRRPKPAVKLSPEVKLAVTPKKRVVSDGNWRRDKIVVTKEPAIAVVEDKSKDASPKPLIVRRSVVTVGLKTSPSTRDVVEQESRLKRVQPLLRQTRARSTSPGGTTSASFESTGLKVYIKSNDKLRPDSTAVPRARKVRSTTDSTFTATSADHTSTATDLTTPERTPTKQRPAVRSATDPKRPTLRRSLSVDSSLRPVDQITGQLNSSGLRKKSPRDANKEPKEREPPRPVPRVFGGHKVQGWLAAMPDDPFTERSAAAPPSEPSDDSRRKSRRSIRQRVEDLESISRSPYADRTSARAITLDSRARDGDDYSDTSTTPTSTLKRSGAHRRHRSAATKGVDDGSLYKMGLNLPALPLSDAKRYVTTPGSFGHTNTGEASSRPSTAGSATMLAPKNLHNSPTFQERSVQSRASDIDDHRDNGIGLKRRLTKHSDLMSALSEPRTAYPQMGPSRSMKSRRRASAKMTVGALMNELTSDELKYQRELRTLVDGVIPVLLNHTIKSDVQQTTSAKNLSTNPAITQSIVDMGVALERLKTTHKRIPMHDPEELLAWAAGAARIYSDYFRSWRLGFHDLVVNLAPAEEPTKKVTWENDSESLSKDQDSSTDAERVDVAYLLKRPLVRVKSLRNTLNGITQHLSSDLAKAAEDTYTRLVDEARKRASDERARLEDEAASAIDPTRARDMQSLAPLNGVSIDATRTVRARDYFDLQLYHTSGQQIDCKIEVILRDDTPGRGISGDVLLCEISDSGRWLLFPPVPMHLVSARKGEKDDELIVMIRGWLASEVEWREIMSLRASADSCAEWSQMLRSDPAPPRLTKQSSFNVQNARKAPYPASTDSLITEDVDHPIGERARETARLWEGSTVNSVSDEPPSRHQNRVPYSESSETPTWSDIGRYVKDPALHSDYDDRKNNGRRRIPTAQLRHARSKSEYSVSTLSTTTKDYSVWLPPSDNGRSEAIDDDDDENDVTMTRPSMRRRTSSVPSQDLPNIHKLRASASAASRQTPDRSQLSSSSRGYSYTNSELSRTTDATQSRHDHGGTSGIVPHSARGLSKLQSDKPRAIPQLNPTFTSRQRRSSSPLKHEYDPSLDTSSSPSLLSDSESEESFTSESSNDDAHEGISTLGDLKDFSRYGAARARRLAQAPPRSICPPLEDNDDSLGPSESASQAPFRRVPTSTGQRPSKTLASIFYWSEGGAWESLHPEECEIVITPGLIEAFDMAQAKQVSPNCHDPSEPSPSQRGVRPIVALELTPLVPLRRGTALDISVRSPPTSNSLLRTGNNIMFRSSSTEDCEKLYGFLNRARIDNPTWIALQHARGPVPTSNWAEVMDNRPAPKSGGGWLKSLSRKSSTYRSTGTRALSTAATESSVGTTNSAFSALRLFGRSRFFNIAKSTILSRGGGTRSTGSDSLDSGVATPISIDPSMGIPVGINNAKIRLWQRESAGKWRDLGTAGLTVMIPRRQDAGPGGLSTEKRILITGRTDGDVLLDVTLPESSFERVARTGIALSLVEEAGHIRHRGGVLTATAKVFMLQMKSEREAAYTFSMVGKLRY